MQEVILLLPLYGAALAVTLCGIAAVNLTVDNPSVSSMTVLLTVIGFGASLAMRMLRVDPNQAMYPLLGFVLFVTLQRLLSGEGLIDVMLGGRGGSAQPDVVLATLLSGLVVLRSFALLTNYSLLFCAVPTIAMLGLTGSSNPDTEIILYFFLFLLATIFMVAYEHHLRLREEIARAEPPSLRSHASTAVALFVAVAAVGGALTLAGRPILSRLSPYTTPILRKAQNFPTFNTALQSSSTYLPVGSGPISLSEAQMFEVHGARGTTLWRTRTFDHWTGRGWTTTQPEEPRIPVLKSLVSFRPPAGQVDREGQYYVFEFEKDPGRTKAVTPAKLTQQIVMRADLPQWVPVPGRTQLLVCPFPEVTTDTAGVINARRQMTRGLAYQVTADVAQPAPRLLRQAPAVDLSGFYEQEYHNLPVGTERVRQLAERLAANHTNAYDKALAMQGYIEKNCPYTLQGEPTPPGTDAVEYYLFTTKEGACDLAGSAMAVMCRAVGIPARVAVGYLEGVEDPNNNARILREADAHLWVELYFQGYGWVTFNPAPISVDAPTDPVGQVARSARRFWRGLARRGLAVVFTLALTLVFLGAAAKPGLDLWWTLVRERRQAALLARRGEPMAILSLRYRELSDALARAGWPRSPVETPAAYLARLRAELPPDLDEVLTAAEFVTDAFTRARYGEESVPAVILTEAEERVKSARRALRKGKKRTAAGRR
jgi:transglutaminase-like putative cysteine protease